MQILKGFLQSVVLCLTHSLSDSSQIYIQFLLGSVEVIYSKRIRNISTNDVKFCQTICFSPLC